MKVASTFLVKEHRDFMFVQSGYCGFRSINLFIKLHHILGCLHNVILNYNLY